MAMERSPSPPLPPDPRMRPKTVQPLRESFPVAPSPSLPPQHHPVQVPDIRLSETSRPRTTSRPPVPILHQPQPVREALHDAFEQSPVAQNQLDPELVRQVTEQVIRNLQNSNIATPTPTPTATAHPQHSQYVPPPPPPVQPVPRSPTQSSTDSAPQRQYTPPSPEKRGVDAGYGSPSSPERVPSDAASNYSRESLRSKASVRSREPPTSMQTDGATGVRRHTSVRRRGEGMTEEERRRRRDSGSDSTARDPSQPFRRDSRGSESDYHEPPARSRVRPARIPSDVQEATTLEKIWQPLFDNGNPTVRLSQFLRGLAIHLIDDYEPKGTLVVTPPKMLRFFNEVRVPDELYPWDTIFGSKMSSVSLSTMYRKLLCQHHLIQYQNHEVPSVPGLTPSGFEWFMTTLIQAHPDQEFERLANAVRDMPISNADNKSERFPKELSRRLLPMQGSLHAEQKVIASLAHEPVVQLKGASNMPPPPPASAPPQQTSFPERERKPYSQGPASNNIDDDDLVAPSFPLERERKPYTAKEGRGKNYSNETEREARPPTSQFKPTEAPPPNNRSARSTSGVPTQSTYSNSSGQGSGVSEPMNIPSRSHRQSMGQGPPPAMLNNMNSGMNGSLSKGRRTPPPRNPYARSEPLDISGIPASQYASNLHPNYPPGGNARDQFAGGEAEDDPHARRNHRRRNSIDRDFRDRDRDRDRDPSTNNGGGGGGGGGGSSSKDDDLSANNNTGRGYPIPPRPRRNSVDRDRPATRGLPPINNSNNIDDETRGGYPIPPRPPPSSQGFAAVGAMGGETGYSAVAGSGGPAPVGSYPRNAGGGGFMDARRSTWYGGGGGGGGNNVGGGTDGYGSFVGGAGGGQQQQQQQAYGSSSSGQY
ncbi:hypothetical protein B0A55_08030 [Friedmanniomyces simplex]|uniref:DUF7514 domain-containing protein n=1 Tax=Friedmanniomyces simplex TaxID=329884 RepID=A0A4U0X3P9_9PEZI|nr:hypothetical protein B0A55_08030 [Friedmanniomyces simplex]